VRAESGTVMSALVSCQYLLLMESRGQQLGFPEGEEKRSRRKRGALLHKSIEIRSPHREGLRLVRNAVSSNAHAYPAASRRRCNFK